MQKYNISRKSTNAVPMIDDPSSKTNTKWGINNQPAWQKSTAKSATEHGTESTLKIS